MPTLLKMRIMKYRTKVSYHFDRTLSLEHDITIEMPIIFIV